MLNKLILSQLQPGLTASGGVLLCGISERQAKSGSLYCVLTLSDGRQTVDARLFNMSLDRLPDWAEEKRVINVTVETDLYNGAPSYIIRNFKQAEQGEYKLEDYIKKAPLDSEEMFDGILEMLHSVTPERSENKPLYCLVREIYEDNRDRLMYWSAAKSIHHDMYGGLLYHTYTMVCLALRIVEVYPQLDAQLLLAAVALHDIGKLHELETDTLGSADYSLSGKLFSHLIIGIEMIDSYSSGDYDADEIACLKHCIASHHGSPEFGALVLPRISEAQALCYIDNIDSRMQQYDKAYNVIDCGQVTAEKIYGLDNVQVYKPLFKSRRGEKPTIV